jgi:unsaturated chondroitin disaccharide hydrolase
MDNSLLAVRDINHKYIVVEKSLKKIERNMDAIGEHFPPVALDGIYNDQGPEFWVSGF